MTIHTVGDTHCMWPWDSIPGVVAHAVGPVLCDSFGSKGSEVIDVRNFGLSDDDYLVFCLGEIDCRCLVYKEVDEQGATYKVVIDGIVTAYMTAIEAGVASVADISLKQVGVYNVVPPVEKETVVENPDFPYLGTDDERLQYVKYFNARLRAECTKRSFLFVDVFDSYADERGFLRKDLSDGNVHLATPQYIAEFLATNGVM